MNNNNSRDKKNRYTLLALLLGPMTALAQETPVETTSYFSNALFNTLLVTILVLAILIVALAGVMKTITNTEMFTEKLRKKFQQSGKAGVLLLGLMFSADAYGASGAADDGRIGGIDPMTFYVMVSVIILELIFIVVMLQSMQQFLKTDKVEAAPVAPKPREKTILDVLSDAVDVENEESILMDHDYDGIKELDNNLPPWWKYGFYLTILFAFVYLVHYHITRTAPLQGEEYKQSIRQAEADLAAFMKNSANNVDESTVKMLDKPEEISAGKNLFIGACAVCHGKLGEGGAGPNLTDDYWLHSGSIKDIFKTIKYGYPDKGMKSWKEDFSPVQMAQMASFIRTLRGTNPPNAKDKQGELYVETAPAPTDSSSVAKDSVVVALPDTLKKN